MFFQPAIRATGSRGGRTIGVGPFRRDPLGCRLAAARQLPRARASCPGQSPRRAIGAYTLDLVHKDCMADRIVEPRSTARSSARPAAEGRPPGSRMVLRGAAACAVAIEKPVRGSADTRDWFFRHFDHAATTVQSYHAGRLAAAARADPRRGLRRRHHRARARAAHGVRGAGGHRSLPAATSAAAGASRQPPAGRSRCRRTAVPAGRRELRLPFEDDRFDVVVSWGSMEHIAGGYLAGAARGEACSPARRALLRRTRASYYSNIGHHLDEFSSEPFFHLKMTRGGP